VFYIVTFGLGGTTILLMQRYTSLATCDCDLFHNHVTLTFDVIFLAHFQAAMDDICTNCGVDSSSHCPFWSADTQIHAKLIVDCAVVNVVYSLVEKEKWLHHQYGSPVTVSKNDLISHACQLCTILRYEFIFAPVCDVCYLNFYISSKPFFFTIS